MTVCSQCQTVPNTLPSEGVLLLVGLPSQEMAALKDALGVYGIVAREIDGGLVSFDLFAGCFEIVLDWARLVSDKLIQQGRYLLLQPGEELSFAHMGRVAPLSGLVGHIKNAWLVEMIRENRLITYFHPIVNAQNPAEIFAHECLMRGVDTSGGIVSPGVVLDAADEEGLLFHLDRACRINAIKSFAAQGVGGRAFINFNPVSVYNPVACLQSTVQAARSVGLPADRIVFELIERNHVADESHLIRVVDFYRNAGYKVALDDVGAGYSGLNLLSILKPDYVKLDMHLIRDVDKDPVRQGIVSKMLEMMRNLGVQTVVEGVETQAEYEFARSAGADFVQGFLFAKPAPQAVGARPLSLAA